MTLSPRERLDKYLFWSQWFLSRELNTLPECPQLVMGDIKQSQEDKKFPLLPSTP